MSKITTKGVLSEIKKRGNLVKENIKNIPGFAKDLYGQGKAAYGLRKTRNKYVAVKNKKDFISEVGVPYRPQDENREHNITASKINKRNRKEIFSN